MMPVCVSTDLPPCHLSYSRDLVLPGRCCNVPLAGAAKDCRARRFKSRANTGDPSTDPAGHFRTSSEIFHRRWGPRFIH